MRQLTCASLFSGIGGFDLAADWMGWKTLLQCECNPFAQKILRYYWPDAELFEDISKTAFTEYENKIDVLTGGFPCQPYSVAGKRKGTADVRHLWPEMLRAVREIKPRWVVGENVRGLIGWDGGLVFDKVQTDLEDAGYEVVPFLLPACGINAPHRRQRIWFVAHRNSAGFQEAWPEQQAAGTKQYGKLDRTATSANYKGNTSRPGNFQGSNGEIPDWDNNAQFGNTGIDDASNPHCARQQERDFSAFAGGERFGTRICNAGIPDWKSFSTQSPVCDGNDGLSGRLDGITFSAWRNKAIMGGGNAIVPQVALQIFRAIENYELLY